MINSFVEMVEEKIEEGNLLTIGMVYGKFNIMDSIVPDFISVDSNIHIKGEWMDMIIPANCEIIYDEFEEEYVFKYNSMTLYFS